ncbi:MobA/MobL family protein [Phaeobacter inhibens]|uniref:MobA/MobL family protein n=1 Tax=Phaeobacter inhibens TaxID=221822 RepID=UPI0003FA2506|nr:MobA/MobL family protein [Phaeobacter inhibens]
MALFSFRHSVKTFSEKRTDETRAAKPGQTAAHLRYIARPQAARVVMQERLSGGSHPKTANLAEEEAQKRKGRVCERFVIALPSEASPEQREALTRAYAEQMSKGIAGYVAAIHDQHGNDSKNPHAHFVLFDVQQKTGGRGRPKSTLGLARKNAIEGAAKLWAELHNEMMRGWGFGPDSEISHLSYADRGIDRIPTIHEGASSRATPEAKKKSKEKWKHIDQGHTRAEANAVIREINKLKESQKNAGTVRLGTGDGDNEAQRNGGIAKQRERGGGNVKAAPGNRPPFKQSGQPVQEHRPVVGDTGPTSGPLQSRAQPRPGRQPPFLAAARLGLARRLRRGRDVRRVYRELIMLRDTLKARLLPIEGQRRLRPEAERHHHRPPKTTKPRSGGAERGA